MIKNLFFILSLCIFTFTVHVPSAYAQRIDKDYIKPMPEIELLSQEEFEAQTTLHEDSPSDDKFLDYSIRIPKDWRLSKGIGGLGLELNTKIFLELLRYNSPARVIGHRSTLTIEALELEYRLTAEQWLLKHLISQGATIEGFKAYSDDHAEALKVVLDRGVTYVIRSAVHMNGKRVVLVEYSSPVEFWKEEKVLQTQVVNSFAFNEKQSKEAVEEMREFTLLDLATVQFPTSWQLRMPNLLSIERLNASLLNFPIIIEGDDFENSSLDGKIDFSLVSAYSAESLEEEIETFENSLTEAGITKGEPVEFKDDFVFHSGFEFVRINAFEAQVKGDKSNTYELWFTLMSAADYFYFVTLLTPNRDDDFFLWSRNTQTYKQVLEDLIPSLDSVAAQ